MASATLKAYPRVDVPKRIRRNGFTPAVIYGYGYEAGNPIQLKVSEVLSTLRKHGNSARVHVEIDGSTKYGAIKEVQRCIITDQIKHVDIQVFKQDDVVKLKVPVHVIGADVLASRRLVVNTLLSEIEIIGEAVKIPQSITINIADKAMGDTITVGDLRLDDDLKLSSELTDAVVMITGGAVQKDSSKEEEKTVYDLYN